jgi:hypothetical protein
MIPAVLSHVETLLLLIFGRSLAFCEMSFPFVFFLIWGQERAINAVNKVNGEPLELYGR